jgi:hypothetical protein
VKNNPLVNAAFPCQNVFIVQHPYMRRFGSWLVCLLAFMAMAVSADIYTLMDGAKIDGTPISINDAGVVFSMTDGTDHPRVVWDDFTQDALRALYANVKKPVDKAMIEPLIEEPPQAKSQRGEITVKPIVTPSRPTTHLGFFAIFSSPVGLFILLVLYATNLFAAYEVAFYRRQPAATVVGLAAIPFFGVLSPIIFISMPTNKGPLETAADEAQTRFQATAPPTDVSDAPSGAPRAAGNNVETAPPPASTPAAAASLPEPVVFRRTEFLFNRRFFETRLAGFFRVVPGEAEKDLVLRIMSSRGEFIGRRITRITPAELYLQVFHDNATADEMIPLLEITEVQILHKDAV